MAFLGNCRLRRLSGRPPGPSTAQKAPAAPDLVMRNFVPQFPNRLWVADITYARSWEGLL